MLADFSKNHNSLHWRWGHTSKFRKRVLCLLSSQNCEFWMRRALCCYNPGKKKKKRCKKHRQNISVMFWDSEFPTGNVPKHKSYKEYAVGYIVPYNLILTAIRKSLAIWLARKTVYLCNMQNKTLSQILFLRMYCHFIRT